MSTTATTHTKALPVLYVAGPMSGLPEFNYPAFNHAAHQLRQAGYPVINAKVSGAGGFIACVRVERRVSSF